MLKYIRERLKRYEYMKPLDKVKMFCYLELWRYFGRTQRYWGRKVIGMNHKYFN